MGIAYLENVICIILVQDGYLSFYNHNIISFILQVNDITFTLIKHKQKKSSIRFTSSRIYQQLCHPTIIPTKENSQIIKILSGIVLLRVGRNRKEHQRIKGKELGSNFSTKEPTLKCWRIVPILYASQQKIDITVIC